MNEELSSYIARQRAKGIADNSIKKALVDIGWKESAIDQVLVEAVPDTPPPPPPTVVAQPVQTKVRTAPANPPSSSGLHTQLNASQVILSLGLLFIIIAATVIIFGSWGTLSPFVRFLVAALPNLILLIIGAMVRHKPNQQHIEEGTTAIGLILLPITCGTFYFQFELIKEINFYLFLVSTLTALPIVLAYDIWQKRRPVAVVTLILAVFTFIALGSYGEWEMSTWFLASGVVGLAALGLSVAMNRLQDTVRFDLYQTFSAIFLLLAIPAVSADQLGIFEGGAEPLTLITFAIVSGTVTLLVGSLYAWLFSQRTEREVSLQRGLQFVSVACYLLPLIMLISDESIYVLLALVVASSIGFLGLKTNVRLFFNAGMAGVVASLLVVLFKEVTDIKTPIFLFILGFVAIGISIALGKMRFARAGFHSPAVNKSLGIISDDEHAALTTTASTAREPRSTSVGRVILFILLFYLAFSILRLLMFGLF